jgi:hypothetical protein
MIPEILTNPDPEVAPLLDEARDAPREAEREPASRIDRI